MSIHKNFLKTALKSALICATVAFGTMAETIVTPPPGDGNKSVIMISTFDELCKIGKDRAYPPGGNYQLKNDIDASPSKTMNGGKGFEPIEGFTGTFNGANKTIKGLYINRPDENTVGLFRHFDYCPGLISSGHPQVDCPAVVVPPVIVRDLKVEVDAITGNSTVGGLVGYNYGGSIINCRVTGGTVKGWSTVGGLAGSSFSTVIKSSAAVEVISLAEPRNDVYSPSLSKAACGPPPSGLAKTNCAGDPPHAPAGGLIGYNTGIIDSSHATGDVSGTKGGIGGLVGINYGGIKHSYAKGNVSSTFGDAGGLVGVNEDGAMIHCSYAKGNASSIVKGSIVIGGNNVGGLVGWNKQADIINCYATGNTAGGYAVGALVGLFKIDDTTRGGTVLVETGGLPGLFGIIGNCFATGGVYSAQNYVGPDNNLIGFNATVGRVYNSYCLYVTGKQPDEMMSQSTYEGWDFSDVWQIDEGESYPYFKYESEATTSISRDREATAVRNRGGSYMPRVSVNGRMLNVKLTSAQSSSSSNMLIRVVDMRGRTVYSRAVSDGVNTLSLTKIPAGRYIVEVKQSGARVGSTPVVIR